MDPAEFAAYVRQFPTSANRDAARQRAAVLRAPRSDDNLWTSLHYAAALDVAHVIPHFIRQGTSANAGLKRDGAPLTVGLTRALRELGYSFQNWTRDGETPLHVAAFVGAAEAAAALLEGGADVDRGTKFDYRPLHYAAAANKRDIIEVLLAHGADVHARTDEVNRPGRTPLDIAGATGSSVAAAALRAHGAKR